MVAVMNGIAETDIIKIVIATDEANIRIKSVVVEGTDERVGTIVVGAVVVGVNHVREIKTDKPETKIKPMLIRVPADELDLPDPDPETEKGDVCEHPHLYARTIAPSSRKRRRKVKARAEVLVRKVPVRRKIGMEVQKTKKY